jgi:hypothetical protein
MRALILTTTLVLLGAGCGTKSCKDGTLLLDVSFSGSASNSDSLQISVEANGATMSATAPHTAGKSGTLEVDFGAGYPSGAQATVTVTALSGGTIVGSGMATVTLSGECAALTVTVADTSAGGEDLSMPNANDMTAPPDLVVGPDLATCVPQSSSQTVYVDPTSGMDDAMHGALPGGCAFKTLTYALAHSSGRINLALATYEAPAETLPFALTGTQSIDCDPNATGNRATLHGAGSYMGDSNSATVYFAGTGNALYNCILKVFSAGGNNCLNVHSNGTAPGGHLAQNCDIGQCSGTAGAGNGVVVINGGDHMTVKSCTFHDMSGGINAGGATVLSVQKSTFTALGSTNVYCPNVAGIMMCGNTTVTSTCATANCAACSQFANTCP